MSLCFLLSMPILLPLLPIPYIIAGKGKRGPDEGKEEIENLCGDASPCPGVQGIKESLPFLGRDKVEDIPEPFPPPREGPN